MTSLDWCECGHIRWWHANGVCLSCTKEPMFYKEVVDRIEVRCEFRLKT